ncbi:MAG: hypothetical protein IJF83_09830 [Methanobrevibacter sp.]|nr:hypothetical protein [Methanobrevibacter sp.]
MKKTIIFLILALVLISLSAVSANENATDLEVDEANDDVISIDDEVKADSTISANSTKGYEGFSTNFVVKLTSEGANLSSKRVIINLNGNNYSRLTDDLGEAVLNIKLEKGTYDVNYYFLGDNQTRPSNGTSRITVADSIKTTLKNADKDINYRQGLRSVFIVRLQTSTGAPVKNQNVTFKANGKTYTAVTDSRGYAQIFLSLKKGKYRVSYSFKSNAPYLSSSGHDYITVKESMGKGNGYWMWASGIKSVNLKTLKARGTKQIFLHSYAFQLYGKSTVTSWIARANSYGMKVHIWVQVFYDGNWVKPIKSDGSIDYGYMKRKASTVVNYAKIKGVAGVHLDYVRFGGTAYKYDNSVKAVNYFVKKVCTDVRKVRPNCIISAAIMPEPGMMEYYYGQDIPTISKYLDVIVPMAYKGNYGKSTSWIQYVTNSFVLDSNAAQVWTGLQAYQSDSKVVKLSSTALLKDSKAAMNGGAKGVVLFRIGITNLLNFNKV